MNGALALALSLQLSAQAEPPDERLYGRVLTAEGERLEGFLRWNGKETHWADVLDGRKVIPWEHIREAERLDEDFRRRREQERSISLPGLRISWEEDDPDDPMTTTSGIRFGHVLSLEPVGDRRARLVLRSGEELELRGGSSDVGRSFRRLVVEDAVLGEVELGWRELVRVDFAPAPARGPRGGGPSARRLRGTLLTRGGLDLTGFVAWDRDDVLTTDVLDGEASGRGRQIPFDSIAAVAREGDDRSRVTLRSGEKTILSGTNDVDSGNRGIEISAPTVGRALVPWEEFDSLRFALPGSVRSPEASYGAFDGGRPLSGAVETSAGERLTGRIRWDNDEEFTWEFIDGSFEGIRFDVELSFVRSIERVGLSAARVTLHDGRSLILENSSDVSEDNRGIFVAPEGGETVLVRWRDLVRATFVG